MDSTFRISSGALSDRGLSEKRPQNEDSYLEMNHCGIFAVADGVGGAQAGEVASQMAMEIVGEAFSNFPAGSDPENVMRAAIERANAAIYQMAQDLTQLASMATTIVALHLNGNIATIGHVGDSRLYRVDRNGAIYRETDDHSMVADEVRAGRMTEEQAENHPSRNIISRALGAEPTVDVDLKTIMVEPGTSFLICSDGITRHISDPEIKGVLAFGGDPIEICQYLKDLCYERGAEDNLTAVVVKVEPTGETASAEPVYAAAPLGVAEPVSVPEPIEAVELDDEESTIATARSPFDITVVDEEEDAELLELQTDDPNSPGSEIHTSESSRFGAETIPFMEQGTIDDSDDYLQIPAEPDPEPATAAREPVAPMQAVAVPVFRNDEIETAPESRSYGSLIKSLGMVLLGMILGVGAFYFAIAPKPVDTGGPQQLESKSENIPFSAYEKNRRNVDADPAGYLKLTPPANDAEDFYLKGRAELLVGNFPQARFDLLEAQKRVSRTDPVNTKVMATDIAVALAITNDPTIQNRMKAEIESALRPPGPSNANTGQ